MFSTSVNDGLSVQVRFVEVLFCGVDSSGTGGKGNCCIRDREDPISWLLGRRINNPKNVNAITTEINLVRRIFLICLAIICHYHS